MRVKVLFGLLALAVCFCSCSEDVVSRYVPRWSIVFGGQSVSETVASKVRDVSFVCLKSHPDAMLYGVDKIRFCDGRIYLADLHSHRIAVYDMKGNYLADVSQKGSGPGEFLEIRNFAVDDSFIYVINNYRHKLLVYDSTDGEFERSMDLPVVADDVERLDNGDFLVASIPQSGAVNMKQTNHLLFVLDENLEIKERLLEYSRKEKVAFAPLSLFSRDEESICFSSLLFDGFTVIPRNYPDSSLWHVGIEFPRPIPLEHRGDNRMIAQERYHYLADTPVCCGDYISLEISDGEYIYDYLYDVRDSTLSANSQTSAYNYLDFPIGSIQRQFVSYLDDYSYYQELVAHGFACAGEEVESHLKNEGAVLLFYFMR